MSPSSVGATRSLGLRAQILLMLLGGAILPLALVGAWLTSSAVRSGEDLLRNHLDESADRFVAAVERRWEFRRADVALIAENEATLRAVSGGTLRDEDLDYLSSLAVGLASTMPAVELRDANGRVRWESTPTSRAAAERAGGGVAETGVPSGPLVRVETPILGAAGRVAGVAVTEIALAAIVPPDSARPLIPGARAGIRNAGTKTVLLPVEPRGPFPEIDQVEIGGENWLVARRQTTGPPLEIVITAPLSPYVAPFERTATVGMVALLVVALLAIALTAVLATRATRPLKELAAASDAVTHGNLDRRVSLGGPTEVRHVGTAFNAMAENLRTTLHALSHRSALAAVGEFATSLSHDVRNALTAIKVDLDRTAMRELADPVASDLVHRALNNVARLENTVTGALRVARRGHSPIVRADLRPVIRAAIDTVNGTFASIPATLDADLPSEPVMVDCDATALEQLFANLLFNAAQALPAGGRASIALCAVNGMAEVLVSDEGTGITPSEMEKLATPFYSSKPNGTGLGLPMARQIVAGHGGDLSIESEKGLGTTVRVRLQLVNESIPSIARSVEDIAPAQMVGLSDKP